MPKNKVPSWVTSVGGRIMCPTCNRYCANKQSYTQHYIRAHIKQSVPAVQVGENMIAQKIDRNSDYLILFDERKVAFGDIELKTISKFLKGLGIKSMFLFVNDVKDSVRFIKIPKNAKK